jgi:hypothetical protein
MEPNRHETCGDLGQHGRAAFTPSRPEDARRLSISCEECSLDGTSACEDCVVTFLLGPGEAAGAVIVDAMEARAMRLLHRHGLLPELRFVRRAG